MVAKIVSGWSSRTAKRSIVGLFLAAAALCFCGWVISGCTDLKRGGGRHGDQTGDTGSTGLLRPKPDEQADNSACLDCHINFADELIVAKHLEHGFACTACHGESVAHGEDEANVTKPDVLFGRSQITPFCKQCHRKHESGKKYDAFVNEWRGRRRPTGVMLLDDATCMDCHGRHVLIGE